MPKKTTATSEPVEKRQCPKCQDWFTPKGFGPHKAHCKAAPPKAKKQAQNSAHPVPVQEVPVLTVHSTDAEIVRLPLACLDDSDTQPRTEYDQQKHEDLCASMRAHGFVPAWPLLVRAKRCPGSIAAACDPSNPEGFWTLLHPVTNAALLPATAKLTREQAEQLAATKYATRYEIIFGHRRSRAARSIGLEEVPTVVRTLSDRAAVELQLIENLQRHDLNPVDEAHGLRRLLELRDESGQRVHTIASIADRIGKSTDSVRDALTLCRLQGDVREAVASGRVGVALAYELAKIPDPEVRLQALREILNPSEGEAPMRHRAAVDWIRRNCTRSLRTDAKFDTSDPDLVPVVLDEQQQRVRGGACTDCAFNSASSAGEPERRGPRLGTCGNVTCFELKRAADFQRFQAQNNRPEDGKVVLSYERNAEVFDQLGEIDWRAGLVPLDEPPDSTLLKPEIANGPEPVGTWRDLTKGRLSEVLVARNPQTGKKVEVLDIGKAKAAVELNQHYIFRTSKPPAARTEAEHKASTLATQTEQQVRALTIEKAQVEIATKAQALGHMPTSAWQYLVRWALEFVPRPALERVARRRGVEPNGFGDYLNDAEPSEMLGLFAELVLSEAFEPGNQGAQEFAGAFGIKLEEVAARARGDVQHAQDKKAA